MKKKFRLIILATLFGALLLSCRKDNSSSTSSIDGKWFQILDSSISTLVGGGNSTTTVNHYNRNLYYTNGNSINFLNGLAFDSSFYTISDSIFKHADTLRFTISGNTLTFSTYSKFSPVSGHSQFQESVSGNVLTLYSTFTDTTFDNSTTPKKVKSIANVKDWLLFSR